MSKRGTGRKSTTYVGFVACKTETKSSSETPGRETKKNDGLLLLNREKRSLNRIVFSFNKLAAGLLASSDYVEEAEIGFF